jgi:hypothetical protein
MVEPLFTARILGTHDARISYVLARLCQPGLTLEAWRRRIQRACRSPGRCAVVGVLNQSGCMVALFAAANGVLNRLATTPMMSGAEDDLVRVALAVLPRND